MALSDEPCLQVLVVLVLERTCLLVVIAICKNGMFENGSCESLTKSTLPLLQGPAKGTHKSIYWQIPHLDVEQTLSDCTTCSVDHDLLAAVDSPRL